MAVVVIIVHDITKLSRQIVTQLASLLSIYNFLVDRLNAPNVIPTPVILYFYDSLFITSVYSLVIEA